MNTRHDSNRIITSAEFRSLDTEGKIMKVAEGFTPPPGKDQDMVLNTILAPGGKRENKRILSLRLFLQAVAACAILLVGIYSVSKVFSEEKIKTGFGSQANLTLPDGSIVTLNSDSKLNWNDRKFNSKRSIMLSGEAFFDVKKGGEFNIKTKNGNVRILGTQLNVYSRDKEFRVSCISGKVGVSNESSEVILLPGEVAELTLSGIEKKAVNNVSQTIAWKEGLFYFEDQLLVSIFAELKRQFGVSVDYKGDLKRKITVSFSNKDLEEALDVICSPMGLKYEIEKNNTIKIFEGP